MGTPKKVQQSSQLNLLRIIDNPDNLRMARPPSDNLLVGGVGNMAAGIAGNNLHHPIEALKNSFNTPETTATQHDRSQPFFFYLRLIHIYSSLMPIHIRTRTAQHRRYEQKECQFPNKTETKRVDKPDNGGKNRLFSIHFLGV